MIFDDTDLALDDVRKKSHKIDKAIVRELIRDKKAQDSIENRLKKMREDQMNFGTRGNKGKS